MGKPKPPAAPDYSRLIKATEVQASRNNDILDQYMSSLSTSTAAARVRADEFSSIVMPQMRAASAMATTQRQRYIDQGIPAENAYVNSLQNYDTVDSRNNAAARAAANVSQAFDQQAQNDTRRLQSYGIDPSQARSASQIGRTGIARASAEAAAGNAARTGIHAQGIAYQGQAAQFLRGVGSSAGQQAQSSSALGTGVLNAGTSADRTSLSGLQGASGIGAKSAGILASGYGAANNIYGNELASWQTQMDNSPGAVLAGLAGTALPFAFGKKFENGGLVDPSMSPSGGAVVDDVNAKLNANEFVLPEDVVRYHGLKNIGKLVSDARSAIPAG